eukprot:606511-Pelagomonas_calceolata.AAC.1
MSQALLAFLKQVMRMSCNSCRSKLMRLGILFLKSWIFLLFGWHSPASRAGKLPTGLSKSSLRSSQEQRDRSDDLICLNELPKIEEHKHLSLTLRMANCTQSPPTCTSELYTHAWPSPIRKSVPVAVVATRVGV